MALCRGKRKLCDDSERAFTTKRVKVEQLLSNLLLENDTTPIKYGISDFDLNPLLEFSDDKKWKKTFGIDSIISDKIFQGFKDKVLQGLAVIRYMLPITVLVLHFRLWIKRLFNNFVRKYNRNHPEKRQVSTFRNFYKIMAMVEDPKMNFTYANLFEIVIQENEIEAHSIMLKKSHTLDSKKVEEIRENESLAKECNYKYWDRMSEFPGDYEMEYALD